MVATRVVGEDGESGVLVIVAEQSWPVGAATVAGLGAAFGSSEHPLCRALLAFSSTKAS